MQIYLHISKKSSTFAADFNSGIHNNQNHTRVMKKECVFRCQFNGNTYRVLKEGHPHLIGESIYWTYKGRRKIDSFSWEKLEGAVGSILCEIGPKFMDNFRSIWS